jgi:hypothetical protein
MRLDRCLHRLLRSLAMKHRFAARLRLLSTLLIATWSAATMPAPASPATQVHSFHLDAPLAQVFPMFTALGERAWAAGWEPELLSGEEERGSAFRTRGAGGRETTWIVIDFRPAEGRASYARLAQDSNIGLVDVICRQSAGGGTDVSVRYTLTALNESGQRFVQEFLEHETYRRMIDEWQAAIRAALTAASDRKP